jgi:hypothetical protein
MANSSAEILDVFFNGRPASSQPIRITLTRKQLTMLSEGRTLQFNAGRLILIVPPAPKK